MHLRIYYFLFFWVLCNYHLDNYHLDNYHPARARWEIIKTAEVSSVFTLYINMDTCVDLTKAAATAEAERVVSEEAAQVHSSLFLAYGSPLSRLFVKPPKPNG